MTAPPYDLPKYRRILDAFEAQRAEVLGISDMLRHARDELAEDEREVLWRQFSSVTGEAFGVQELLALKDDELKQRGLRRTSLLEIVERRRRVAALRARYATAGAALAERGVFIDALKRYVREQQ